MSKSFSRNRIIVDNSLNNVEYERKLAKKYLKMTEKHRKTVRKNKRLVAEMEIFENL